MAEKLKIIGEWDDDLIWCPSQCHLKVEYDGKPYLLYLHWRWNDPWKGYVIRSKSGAGDKQSPDLFAKYNEQYRDDELDLAKEALIRLAEKWLSEGEQVH